MCLYPRLIDNPKFKKNKKNGGNIPAVTDQRTLKVPVGCQTCLECRKQKSREWQARLQEDIKHNTNAKFITLTYSTQEIEKYIEFDHESIINSEDYTRNKIQPLTQLQGYEFDNQLATRTLRHFLERWRKEHKKSLRHWLVTELGHEGTEHIHLHGIVWTDNLADIERLWKYGYVWTGHKKFNKTTKKWYIENYVSDKTVNYITKYVTKTDDIHLTYKPIVLTSPGIGSDYTKKHRHKNNIYNGNRTNETYRTGTGHKIALPIYWRNKIYTEEQREKLWLQKLDKQERWVCGEKVSIKNGLDSYYNVLDYHRGRTIQLGYPAPKFIWSRQKYEHERRILIQGERFTKFGACKATIRQRDD